MEEKSKILRARKGMTFNGHKVFVDSDLTKEEQEIQFEARKFAKQQEEEAKVAVAYKKVWVNGRVNMEKQLPRNFRWNWTAATRDLARGRPWGGKVIGVRKELKFVNFWDNQRRYCSGIDIITNNSTYNIYNIYNRDGVKAIRDLITDK